MGLLDQLSGIAGNMMNGQQGGNNPLLQMAIRMLAGRDGTAGGNGGGLGALGGLGGLINAFQNAGLGEQLKSWISTGANMPISADQITDALGSDKIRDIANQLGLPHGEVSGGLADMLPQLIDKLTPHGQLPPDSHNGLADVLAALLKR